jgi:hypothetical protein
MRRDINVGGFVMSSRCDGLCGKPRGGGETTMTEAEALD